LIDNDNKDTGNDDDDGNGKDNNDDNYGDNISDFQNILLSLFIDTAHTTNTN
jgi:hypothetical protein